LILTGDAAESLEVMYPYQRLLEEGYDVHIAAPTKKKLRFVVHDFEPGYDTYTEKPGYTWDADLAFADVNPPDYAALVIPGGRAPEHIRNHEAFSKMVRHFFDQKKTSGPTLPRPARAHLSRRFEGTANCGVPCSRAGHSICWRRICEFRSGGRRRDGFSQGVAG
jgi:hypothetical protein